LALLVSRRRQHGKTVDFLLRRDRGIAAAQAFFRKALASTILHVPRKVTLDGHVQSRRALWLGNGTRTDEEQAAQKAAN
jgi:transposase-like protein